MDMWDKKPYGMWDWDTLRKDIMKYGTRNSLTMAPMPTASTSQILGYNECFEPVTSNMYSRRVLSGEFQVVNPYLLRDLVDLGIWDEGMKPVSYTHLDVYKRQGCKIVGIATTFDLDFLKEKGCDIIVKNHESIRVGGYDPVTDEVEFIFDDYLYAKDDLLKW